jgi:hypothetical protein
MSSFAQYGPGTEELPVNTARGNLRRNATNDGWEQKTPENLLADAAASIAVNGQKITGIGTPSAGSSDAATTSYADSVGVSSVNRAAYVLITETQTTGTSQPLSLADSLFTGYVPGGSIAGAGVLGVVSVSFASVGAETGTGSGQGGLGSSPPDPNQPYNRTDFPGSHEVECQFLKPDGSAVLVQDILSAPPVGQGGQEVEAYLSYRSDLGANLKWRFWFYYRRTSDAAHVSFTPDISLSSARIYAPIVSTLAAEPVGSGLGKVSGTPAATGVIAGTTSDIQQVGTAAAAGASGRFADAQHVHAHGNQTVGTLHAAVIASGTSGFMTGSDKAKLDGLPSSAVPTTRNLIAGAGLTGGGDLSADRTFNAVANADGSIVVNADDIQVGILATDAQHGARGGGTQHAVATQSVNGFMVSTDKAKLDNIAGDVFNITTTTTNATPFDITAYTPPDGKEVTVTVDISARKSDGTAGASYKLFGGFRRSGGTTTQIGNTKVVAFVRDSGFGVDTTFSVSGSTINVNVTGLTSTTIDWRAMGQVVIAP